MQQNLEDSFAFCQQHPLFHGSNITTEELQSAADERNREEPDFVLRSYPKGQKIVVPSNLFLIVKSGNIDVITELKKPSINLKTRLGGLMIEKRSATTGETMKKIGKNFGRFLTRQSTTLNLNLPPEDQYLNKFNQGNKSKINMYSISTARRMSAELRNKSVFRRNSTIDVINKSKKILPGQTSRESLVLIRKNLNSQQLLSESTKLDTYRPKSSKEIRSAERIKNFVAQARVRSRVDSCTYTAITPHIIAQ